MKVLSFLLPFVLYVLTATHSIILGDASEFVIAACGLGVPHPPGSPIYVLIGKLFCLIPLDTPAFRLSLMSAFFGAATCWMLFCCLERLGARTIASFGGAMALGVSQVFWFVSRIPEVYTLHTFLTIAALFLAICYFQNPKSWTLHWLGLVIGLGMANHWPLMVAALPSIGILLITGIKKEGPNAFKSLGFFLIGPALYLLLPVFSATNPIIDWGHVRIWENFWAHVSRSSTTENEPGFLPINRWLLFKYFFIQVLIKDFSWVGFPLALYGATTQWKQRSQIILSAIVGFVLTNASILLWVKISWTGPLVEVVWTTFSAGAPFMALLIGLAFDNLAQLPQLGKKAPNS